MRNGYKKVISNSWEVFDKSCKCSVDIQVVTFKGFLIVLLLILYTNLHGWCSEGCNHFQVTQARLHVRDLCCTSLSYITMSQYVLSIVGGGVTPDSETKFYDAK